MTVIAPSAARGVPAGAVPRGWIASPAFDLPLFVFAPVAGLLFLATVWVVPPAYAFIVQTACFYFVAVPHYMSTYTFFLGDENRKHYRQRRLAFFAGPVGIALAVTVLWVLRFPPIIQASVFIWNTWHVARQNNGILSMYRRLHGGSRDEFAPANWALLGVSSAMALSHIELFPSIGQPLARLHPQASTVLAVLFAIVGLVALARLLVLLRRPGRHVAWQEWAFLGSALVMFHPYLWVRDYTVATLGMLMGHFVQYLAIVWLVHRRTFEAATLAGSAPQRLLGRVSTRTALVGMFIFVCGSFFFVAEQASRAIGVPSLYTVSWFAFTFIHFYLDGFLWAFRDPYVRDSVGRLLMPAERIAA